MKSPSGANSALYLALSMVRDRTQIIGICDMEKQTNCPPQHVREALDATICDLKSGRTHDAPAVRAEGRRRFGDHA